MLFILVVGRYGCIPYWQVSCKHLLAIKINIIYVLSVSNGEKIGWLIFCLINVCFLFHEEHVMIKTAWAG
ncbi:hypothetical protein Dda3937_00534 [Dickeya dadantii 3937]|uniref:Uncharacterized protein n=1 Tax=Dickeya dadantii (strain 3937) TaxID=198628 RepID=E0SIZ3_DICD3|nr:hypothetical protein Dda3937_00534 [Dickeya dadantii 3937]